MYALYIRNIYVFVVIMPKIDMAWISGGSTGGGGV